MDTASEWSREFVCLVVPRPEHVNGERRSKFTRTPAECRKLALSLTSCPVAFDHDMGFVGGRVTRAWTEPPDHRLWAAFKLNLSTPEGKTLLGHIQHRTHLAVSLGDWYWADRNNQGPDVEPRELSICEYGERPGAVIVNASRSSSSSSSSSSTRGGPIKAPQGFTRDLIGTLVKAARARMDPTATTTTVGGGNSMASSPTPMDSTPTPSPPSAAQNTSDAGAPLDKFVEDLVKKASTNQSAIDDVMRALATMSAPPTNQSGPASTPQSQSSSASTSVSTAAPMDATPTPQSSTSSGSMMSSDAAATASSSGLSTGKRSNLAPEEPGARATADATAVLERIRAESLIAERNRYEDRINRAVEKRHMKAAVAAALLAESRGASLESLRQLAEGLDRYYPPTVASHRGRSGGRVTVDDYGAAGAMEEDDNGGDESAESDDGGGGGNHRRGGGGRTARNTRAVEADQAERHRVRNVRSRVAPSNPPLPPPHVAQGATPETSDAQHQRLVAGVAQTILKVLKERLENDRKNQASSAPPANANARAPGAPPLLVNASSQRTLADEILSTAAKRVTTASGLWRMATGGLTCDPAQKGVPPLGQPIPNPLGPDPFNTARRS